MIEAKMFVNGKFKDSEDGTFFESVNPANGNVVALVANGGYKDVEIAVRAARKAYIDIWSQKDPIEKAQILFNIANEIEKNSDELARLDMLETGKPLADCQWDIPACVDIFKYQAGVADKILGSVYPVQRGSFAFSKREPYGVVAAIIPWNYPIYNACLKVAPILAAGNCCILKPAEQSSLSALKLAEIMQKAGLPDGVFNVVTGIGEKAGAALSLHKDIDMISFTGSTEVGRSIMKSSAESNLKVMSLELGGKSPFIIFDDADIEQAVDKACMTIFFNQGQTCTAGSRLLVQKTIKNKVIDILLNKIKKIVVGDPLDENTMLGAIVSEEQFTKVMKYIELGISEGASLLCGGKAIHDIPNCEKGFFVEPTVFDNVNNKMRIGKEEIFGPVLSVMTFDTEEEAIALANDTTYGLAASIWSNSSARVLRMAQSIDAGIIWSNCVARENTCVPVGGFKQSGFGKEGALEAGLEYTRLKTVWINMAEDDPMWIE